MVSARASRPPSRAGRRWGRPVEEDRGERARVGGRADAHAHAHDRHRLGLRRSGPHRAGPGRRLPGLDDQVRVVAAEAEGADGGPPRPAGHGSASAGRRRPASASAGCRSSACSVGGRTPASIAPSTLTSGRARRRDQVAEVRLQRADGRPPAPREHAPPCCGSPSRRRPACPVAWHSTQRDVARREPGRGVAPRAWRAPVRPRTGRAGRAPRPSLERPIAADHAEDAVARGDARRRAASAPRRPRPRPGPGRRRRDGTAGCGRWGSGPRARRSRRGGRGRRRG